jgi:exportin-2 (importin alpha re-exporter)
MQNYYTPILQLILEKLDKSKSESVKIRFVRFYHLVSANADNGLGADFFIKVVETIAPAAR